MTRQSERMALAAKIKRLSKTMCKADICKELGINDVTLRSVAGKYRIEFPVTAVGRNQHQKVTVTK